jgi:tetratricopeptide (TPR) repeat protein
MELGQYANANRKLEQLADKKSLDYLIRKAKYADHKGNLDEAIRLMETALEKVKGLNKKSSFHWVLSNLADMYGHAGRIQEAYKAYLEVLKTDSANLYCLKGIAWIAYSQDRNTIEAKRILQFIQEQTSMPDMHLLLAQIAEYENNETEMKKQLDLFLKEASRPVYGAMYNKYLIDIYTSVIPDLPKALALAQKEVNSRPTPQTYEWLARVYYKMGDIQKAGELIERFVLDKTFEPEALMNSAVVLAANGRSFKAKELLNECLQSSFELGPVKTAAVRDLLKEL